jgi:hypothetical protein
MRDRLIALGWSEIETVDDDLGRSAAGGVARAGFERMVAEGLPRAGLATSTSCLDDRRAGKTKVVCEGGAARPFAQQLQQVLRVGPLTTRSV